MNYIIIAGKEVYVRQFEDIHHAKGWALKFLMADGEVIIRPFDTLDISTRIEIK